MTIPHIPFRLTHPMSLDDFAIYLELSILWHKDIRDSAHNDFDRRWKQGQIDLLQDLLDDIDGKVRPSVEDEIMKMYHMMVREWNKK